MKTTMKIILYTLAFTLITGAALAQDFNKDLASAKTAYSGGNLEDARFAMQQMMNDIDMVIGREILKLLPAKMDAMTSDAKTDNVTANTGLAGVLIHRDYGTGEQTCDIDIMGNSPLVASINAILAIPFVANSGDQKVVKIAGYKGVLQKSVNTDAGPTDYTLQIPLNSSLLTFKLPKTTEADVLRLANTIPVPQIAKMVQ
jgi:hypothetical protein